ncbi:5-amino-6-(D-ribitylamino)uracil--L-tyrosine 4-hydroxyphenyl transferase CofH [Streptomyces sp. NPDC056244]|uniref:5-amino-6-(D-ribitylamino)uracil--L-tyrosine 4-hydroxyphenyl transferase CofH n=1 Tax=Streptomyces sp. NPDC056244 TaxID=3345762 RepID=UPI0035E2261E
MNGHDDAPAADRPTATVLRRALKRAADGVSLDVTEAAVLLQARSPDLTALTGIGETYRERAESLFALRAVAREHDGVQEVIVQNFRAKPDTAMRGTPHARLDEPAATIAVARVVLGPSARIQAPPNLVGDEHAAMLRAGIDDWGGVSPLTPDHVNPGHPWPGIGELAHRTAGEGFTLRERLTAQPEFVRRGDPWIGPRALPHVTAPADPETGLAREGVVPRGLPWQSGGASLTLSGRTDLNRTVDTDADADAYTLSLSEVADRAEEAWNAGATEVCVQVGIHPDLPGTVYFDIARAVKERVPDLHLHAFSPMEAANGAARAGLSTREWLTAAKEAGVDSIPGTAAEILDDEVRWILTRAKLPAAAWIEVAETAHEVGLRSSSTMMYGHVDRPDHWLHHLRVLADVQRGTGGFTEFVTLPFIPTNAPVYLAGVARQGPTARENRVVTVMARLLLHGLVPHIRTSWVKLGTEGSTEMEMLCSGADDMGGTLMEETISRMAGSRHSSYRSVSGLEAIAKAAGRPARQRTTPYGPVPAERIATARTSDGVLPEPDGAAPGKLLPLFPTSPSATAAASAAGCPTACRGGPAVARPE